jgi:hypothetical protein
MAPAPPHPGLGDCGRLGRGRRRPGDRAEPGSEPRRTGGGRPGAMGRPRPVPAGLAADDRGDDAALQPAPHPSVRPSQRQSAQAAAGQGGVPRRLRRPMERLRSRRLPRRPGDPPPGRPLELAGHPARTARRRGPAAGRSVPVLDPEGPLPAGLPAPGRLSPPALPARDGRGVSAGRGPRHVLRGLLLGTDAAGH